jgi:hypothetical protein
VSRRDFLPIAPRPFEDELLSSWQGRVACRYDLSGDGLSEQLGVVRYDRRVVGFAGRDFAPGAEAISIWARASRLSEGRVREMALSTRPRPRGCYVWGEGNVAGAFRRPVCPACLDEDADARRDHHIRRSWALVESCICDRHDRVLSETCPNCSSSLGFRFRNRGDAARLVCIRCDRVVRSFASADAAAPPGMHSFFGMFTSILAEPVDERRSKADELMQAARLLWAPPRARSWSRTPFIARVMPDTPRLPSIGTRVDRREPLATVSFGWRMVTLIGVAQLLDLGGARQFSGSPSFTLDQLADWTGYARPAARIRRVLPIDAGPSYIRRPPRIAHEYRARAETNDFWRRLATEVVAENAAQLTRLSVEAKLGALMREAESRRNAAGAGGKMGREARPVSTTPTQSHQFRLGPSHDSAPPVSQSCAKIS